MTTYRAIDLFSGCGGLSLGLQSAGWEIVTAVERDQDACASYRANVGDHVIERDIADVDAADLPDCDLIAGGPPCQGFSYAGKRDPGDPRNRLWHEFFRIVEGKRPAYVLIENVRGMLTVGEDKSLIQAFASIGYRISPYLLNCADYGVPQRRMRVFFVGNRLGLPNPCPTQTHAKPPGHVMFGLAPWVTVRQALGIGGVMTHCRNPFSSGAGQPFYDGASSPARTQATTPGAFVEPRLTNGHFGGFAHEFGVHEPAWTFGERSHAWLMTDRRSLDRHDGVRASDLYDGASMPVFSQASTPHAILDTPSRALRAGAHGQPGYSDRHVAGYVPDPILDRESVAIRGANGGSDLSADGTIRSTTRTTRPFGWIPADAVAGIPFDVAPTIQADPRLSKPGHHGPGESRMGLRRLTVDECAILQAFPRVFAFHGSKTSQYRQIGNAVPPLMARHLGAAILAVLANRAAT